MKSSKAFTSSTKLFNVKKSRLVRVVMARSTGICYDSLPEKPFPLIAFDKGIDFVFWIIDIRINKISYDVG